MSVAHLNQSNFDAALAENPVVLVDFWADWCGPCKMLGPTIEQLAELYDGRALVAKVNVDESGALAQRFGVMTIPTVIFFQGGAETGRQVGVSLVKAYTEVMDKLLG